MSTEMRLSAGEEVVSHCLKCKDITNHIIIAMTDGKVAKVQCNTCGGRHRYRPPEPAATIGAGSRPAIKKEAGRQAGRTVKETKAAAQFEALVAGRDPSRALAYAMDASFRKNDLLDHPIFGLGVVTRTIRPDKIEVQFRKGNKLLVCTLPPLKF